MILKNEIIEIASILDDDIAKAEKSGRSKVEQYEEEIVKALSHDPFEPHVMGNDSPYYNPYQTTELGFMPYRAEYWRDQGKDAEAYLTTRHLYERLESRKANVVNTIRDERLESSFQNFSRFQRACEQGDLMKAGAVPIGTVHTYRDGQRYKKISEGRWTPMAGLEKRSANNWLEHKDPTKRIQANMDIEGHAGQVEKVKEAMLHKQREEKTIGEAKRQAMHESISTIREAMKKLYDGKEPPEMKKMFDTASAKHADPAAKDPKAQLEHVDEAVRGGKKHHVEVHFRVGDKAYKHRFENVAAEGHADATNKVLEGMKSKFGNAAVINKIHAETAKKEEKEA